MIDVFQYPEGPEPTRPSWVDLLQACPMSAIETIRSSAFPGSTEYPAHAGAPTERIPAEETLRSFEAGRKQGMQEGCKAEAESQSVAIAASERRRIEQAASLVEQFSQQRIRFLHDVEHELVQLALAIAARILRREAQMDPLLLTGAVRVALGQLSNSTQVRLRVPPSELELWAEAMALLPNLSLRPTVLAADAMRLGDCTIETELGSVDLGIRAQLGEIERGLFDRAGGKRTEAVVAGCELQKQQGHS